MVHIILPVHPQGQQAAGGEQRVIEKRPLIQEENQDEHRPRGGQHHQNPNALVKKQVNQQRNDPQQGRRPGQRHGEHRGLSRPQVDHRHDRHAHGQHRPHNGEHLEEPEQRGGQPGAENHLHVQLLQQQDEQLNQHRAAKPQKHPVKNHVFLFIPELPLSLLEHHSSILYRCWRLRGRPLPRRLSF